MGAVEKDVARTSKLEGPGTSAVRDTREFPGKTQKRRWSRDNHQHWYFTLFKVDDYSHFFNIIF